MVISASKIVMTARNAAEDIENASTNGSLTTERASVLKALSKSLYGTAYKAERKDREAIRFLGDIMGFEKENIYRAIIGNHVQYVKGVIHLVVAGLLVGTGNALWALLNYVATRDASAAEHGVNAVFGKSTQQYMLITTFFLLILVPLVPFLIKTLKVVYETIVFGLAFLFINALIFLVAAEYANQVDGEFHSQLIDLLKTFVMMFISGLFIGPLIFSGFEADVEKKGSIINWGKGYIILYAIHAAIMVALILYTIWVF